MFAALFRQSLQNLLYISDINWCDRKKLAECGNNRAQLLICCYKHTCNYEIKKLRHVKTIGLHKDIKMEQLQNVF